MAREESFFSTFIKVSKAISSTLDLQEVLDLIDEPVEDKMNRIIVNPRILGGKPIIEGTRLSVEFIIGLLASGISKDEIVEDYPHITKKDIHACLRFIAQT